MDGSSIQWTGVSPVEKGLQIFISTLFLFLRYDFHPQTLSLRAIDVLFQNIERWIQYLRFENMPCNRICNKVSNLKPYHIVSFGDKVKSLHVRLQPFRSYPICAFVAQLIVVAQKILVFSLSSHFCYYLKANVTFCIQIVKVENGSFHQQRKRLAIDIVKASELADVFLF